MKAITETWISLEEEDSDGDDCEGDVFKEEKDEEDVLDTTVKEKENSSKLTYCEISFSEYDKCVE